MRKTGSAHIAMNGARFDGARKNKPFFARLVKNYASETLKRVLIRSSPGSSLCRKNTLDDLVAPRHAAVPVLHVLIREPSGDLRTIHAFASQGLHPLDNYFFPGIIAIGFVAFASAMLDASTFSIRSFGGQSCQIEFTDQEPSVKLRHIHSELDEKSTQWVFVVLPVLCDVISGYRRDNREAVLNAVCWILCCELELPQKKPERYTGIK